MALVTGAQAIAHLRLPGSPEDYEDLLSKAEQATAIVINYLKREDLLTGSPAWTDATQPTNDDLEFAIVQASVLDVLANLYQHRGDDGATDGPLTNRIRAILSMLRDPSLA